jgi:predicted nucleotidyltransferase
VTTALNLDRDVIASLCRAHNVTRLRLFGSAIRGDFDPALSDVDFLVEFAVHTPDLFDAYFGLKEDLEALVGRPVDLVMSNAVANPYFAKSALDSAEELYAA